MLALSLFHACSSKCELSTCCSRHQACLLSGDPIVTDSSLWNRKPNKPFLPYVAMVTVFYQSNRKKPIPRGGTRSIGHISIAVIKHAFPENLQKEESI